MLNSTDAVIMIPPVMPKYETPIPIPILSNMMFVGGGLVSVDIAPTVLTFVFALEPPALVKHDELVHRKTHKIVSDSSLKHQALKQSDVSSSTTALTHSLHASCKASCVLPA